MTAKDCILGRRSIRKFKADPVSHDLIAQIVETASYSPSWKHTQITRYIAVEGALKDKIAGECSSPYPPNGDIISAAPVLMAVTIIKNRSGFERDGSFSTPRGDGWQMYDAASHPRVSVSRPMNRALVPLSLVSLTRARRKPSYSFLMTESWWR